MTPWFLITVVNKETIGIWEFVVGRIFFSEVRGVNFDSMITNN